MTTSILLVKHVYETDWGVKNCPNIYKTQLWCLAVLKSLTEVIFLLLLLGCYSSECIWACGEPCCRELYEQCDRVIQLKWREINCQNILFLFWAAVASAPPGSMCAECAGFVCQPTILSAEKNFLYGFTVLQNQFATFLLNPLLCCFSPKH